MYEFTHEDGRGGVGETVELAFLDAVGKEGADGLLPLHVVDWQTPWEDHEEFVREAHVWSVMGAPLGLVRQRR